MCTALKKGKRFKVREKTIIGDLKDLQAERNSKETKQQENSEIGNAPQKSQLDVYKKGEYLAVFWDEGNCRTWYLGAVESIEPEGIAVSHFKVASRSKEVWLLFDDFEEQDIAIVKPEQVIASNINVKFPLSSGRLKVFIDTEVVKMINERLNS